ncbi:cytochrome P450 [Sporichthya polymorpha]|uniref:cytochrome P450 n=1 Tax=Sporichthya polymorpha TaxID=35751 RepID=UPI001B7FEFDB|nr:cytochrome P450 [Sporichthya polymorpha]
MTETQQQPGMLDMLRSTWDTCPMFGQLREAAPVMYVPEMDAWVLSRYEDVVVAAKDTKRFGSMPADLVGEVPDEVKDQLPHGYAPWIPALVNTNPPEHTRIRRLANHPLTAKSVARREDAIREAANALIDEFVADGRADLVEKFATPMPLHVLIRFLGVPEQDLQRFRDWTLGIVELFLPSIAPERRLELARDQVKFSEYLNEAIAARRKEPGDDAISELVLAQEEGENKLTDLEILGIIGQFIIAGFETSAGGISFSLYMLAQHPEIAARLRDDLSLVPKAVEESLRRLTPARGIVRRVLEDVEFGGQKIPAGSNLFLLVQSANNDPTVFNCPEKFDIDRENSEMRKSIHFGTGPHLCIGAPLARLDMRIALETVLTRLPNLRVVPGQEIRVQDGMIFHRPERLEFEWDV